MAYGHSGRVTGFNSDAWYYADRQTAIVFITNGDYGDSALVMINFMTDSLFYLSRRTGTL
ncbi:MAG: hypothetical protein JW384_03554 [Nitrosomonadaceae bacterium]|nr:hypothetical protein [Nitrosomonadaceae bacterium]